MDLKFLGRGAAFNPKEGSTSAYFIENNILYLIDCGESVFAKLIEYKLLNNIKDINLLITHTHSDHVGSLGSLAIYSYYNLHKPINIIVKKEDKHFDNIDNVLCAFGCSKEMYQYIYEEQLDNKLKSFQTVRYIETRHSKELNCYGLIFTTEDGIIYYSGDTGDTSIIDSLVKDNNVYKMYVETSTTDLPNNPHLNVSVLESHIPKNIRNKVYCMHFNSDECINEVKKLGFNVVEIDLND